MSTLNTSSSFISYNLTSQELLEGYNLNISNQQVIQNDMAQIAEQLIALDFDPTEPQKFVQNNAFLRGQLSAFQTILERSNMASKTLSQPDLDSQF